MKFLQRLFGSRPEPSSIATLSPPEPARPVTKAMEDRLKGALWGALIGDALSSPTHWYYGGESQVRRDYGEIRDYVKPKEQLQGSIMNKSNTGGGGRGGFGGSIIGDVINHGKKEYWTPRGQYHYHCTLDAGENTLEAQLLRLLMRTMTACGGNFDRDTFAGEYEKFMTTPGSHNDTYASTCHRMFFANRIRGKPLEACPDNDNHNVDTMDGLVLPCVVAIGSIGSPAPQAEAQVAQCVRATRNSPQLEQYAKVLTGALRELVNGATLPDAMQHTAERMGLRGDLRAAAGGPDTMTA